MKVPRRRGGALVFAMVTLLVVMLLAAAVCRLLVAALRSSRRQAEEVQAQWLAEAAVARGLAKLRLDDKFSRETWQPRVTDQSRGQAEIRVERSADERPARLVVEARYPDDPWQRAVVGREVLLTRGEAAP